MKKIIKIALSLMTIATVLVGCGNTNKSAPQQTAAGGAATEVSAGTEAKTVVIGIATDLKTLDPGHQYEVFGNLVSYAIYDMLFRNEGDNIETPKPSLVEENWTLDDTRTVYTFTLKDGVKFTSGNPLTSADVIWSINRVRNLKSNAYPHVEGIADIQAPDAKTVVITLKAPDASFLAKLASNAYCVLDSELVKQNGGTDAEDASTADTAKAYLDKNSAGSGPYKLVSWTPNVEVILEKNTEYWGQVGNVDKYILKEIPDSNTQIQMIEKGEIDIAFTLNSDNIGQLEGKDGVNIVKGQSSTEMFLLMNQDEVIGGPLSNPDVQQAVRCAIDYKGLLTLSGEGGSLPVSLAPKGFIGAITRDEGYQNIDKAKELLAKAGYENGFDINLITSNFDTEGVSWVTMAQKIQSDLAAVGINVKVETLEIGVAIDQYREGKCPFLVMHWSPDYYDINNQLAFLPGNNVGLRANWTADANPDLVSLGEKIIGEPDTAAREQYVKELQNMMSENSPYAFLLQPPKIFATRNNLDNVVYNDLSKIQLKEMNVK